MKDYTLNQLPDGTYEYTFVWETGDTTVSYIVEDTVVIQDIAGPFIDSLDEGFLEDLRQDLCEKHGVGV